MTTNPVLELSVAIAERDAAREELQKIRERVLAHDDEGTLDALERLLNGNGMDMVLTLVDVVAQATEWPGEVPQKTAHKVMADDAEFQAFFRAVFLQIRIDIIKKLNGMIKE